jgi:diguanylate cyclase (GGDEF)-like protein
VIGRRLADTDAGLLASMPTARGLGSPFAAPFLAVLLFLGGLAGSLPLAFQGVLRDGDTTRWVYGATMFACMACAVPLAVRRRAGRWHTFGLVLFADLVYLVVALSVSDPLRYATPLMLLFPVFVASWFLGVRELITTMAVTTVFSALALAGTYSDPVMLAFQVAITAGILNLASVGVFILRRRVERLLAETQTLSHLDPLTGLFNRRYLVEQAPRAWRQARREGTRVAAMVLDLDHFKKLNDAHGHAAGDAVLRAVADSLGATVRPTDVLARIGGEELVVLGLVGDSDEARRLAERLRAAVAHTRTEDGHAVTTSIGIALTRPEDGENATEALWRLIDRADAAMYEAKQAGRDRVAGTAVPRPRSPRTRRPSMPEFRTGESS